MTEIWKPVVGFEKQYEVSDQGRVRSLDRAQIYTRKDQYSGRDIEVVRRLKGKILRPGKNDSGHVTVAIGKGNSKQVHRLVLEAFVGPCPEGEECLHGPAGPDKNFLTNIRWGDRSQNIRDDLDRGVRRQGENHHWYGKLQGAALARTLRKEARK